MNLGFPKTPRPVLSGKTHTKRIEGGQRLSAGCGCCCCLFSGKQIIPNQRDSVLFIKINNGNGTTLTPASIGLIPERPEQPEQHFFNLSCSFLHCRHCCARFKSIFDYMARPRGRYTKSPCLIHFNYDWSLGLVS